MTAYLLAATCLTVAGIHSAGWSPAWAAEWPTLLSQSLPLAGYTMLLVGSLLFARYVILDVQGLIEHRVVTATAPAASQTEESTPYADEEEAYEELGTKPAVVAETSAWVDGSEPEMDDDEEGSRRMSKADRKRLRKQKQRNRAA